MHRVTNILEGNRRALEVKEAVHDTYNQAVDSEDLRMAWGVSKVSSRYKSGSGRFAQNWPYPLLEFWKRTREVDPADYDLI